MADLEFRKGGPKNLGVPCSLLAITNEITTARATYHVDLGKFPLYSFNEVMKENKVIENHCCKCQDFIYELSVITNLCCATLSSKLKLVCAIQCMNIQRVDKRDLDVCHEATRVSRKNLVLIKLITRRVSSLTDMKGKM